MKWLEANNETKFQTGDIIETTSSFLPCTTHFGVVFNKDGVQHVSHNPFLPKEFHFEPKLEPLADFLQDRKVIKLIRNERTQQLTDKYIYEQSQYLIGRDRFRQDIFLNCENWAESITGINIPTQRIGWIIVIIIVILLVWALVRYSRR